VGKLPDGRSGVCPGFVLRSRLQLGFLSGLCPHVHRPPLHTRRLAQVETVARLHNLLSGVAHRVAAFRLIRSLPITDPPLCGFFGSSANLRPWLRWREGHLGQRAE